MIYLDNAATSGYTSVDDIIVDTMTRAMKRYWHNPSSPYAYDVKEEIDKCRAKISRYIGAKPEEIYFTSGASESNNWAIRGFADATWEDMHKVAHIITTKIEHKSILDVVKNDFMDACRSYCNVDSFGMVDYYDLKKCLELGCDMNILTSISIANNEIGTVQHIKVISDLVHRYNGVLHVDATQALGHIPINVKELGIDMMSCSGHKISPVLKGIGFLYKKNGVDIKPLIYGSQEQGLRGGTENTFGIIGLSKAIDYCDVSYEAIEETINLRDYFINKLETKFGCKLNGHNEYRLPNHISVTFPQDVTGESILYALDLDGIQCGVGSACNSKEIKPSHVLKAIGLTDIDAMKTVRFTLSDDTTYEDVDYVIEEIDKALKVIESLKGSDE